MNEDQILMDWMGRKSNRDKLPIIAYPMEVYTFIIDNCSAINIDNDTIWKVNNIWQKVTFISEKQKTH
jgi:hypothetical protein